MQWDSLLVTGDRLMALVWASNRAQGRAATQWCASATWAHGSYHIEPSPVTWAARLYYVFYVGPDGSGQVCKTTIGSACTVGEAKQIAKRHDTTQQQQDRP